MDLTTTQRRWLAIGAPILLLVLAAAFWWFRPDALFVDRTVDDDLDPGVASALAVASTPSPTPSPVATPTPTPTPEAIPDPVVESTAAPAPTATERPSPPRPADETPPPPTGPEVLGRGDWVSLEHETTGTVALIDDDGDLQVALSDLSTSNGPDLRVILSPKPGVADDWYGYEDGATYLGALRGNQGTQVYDVPDDLDVDDIASVVIWCERFSVGFGAANLS